MRVGSNEKDEEGRRKRLEQNQRDHQEQQQRQLELEAQELQESIANNKESGARVS